MNTINFHVLIEYIEYGLFGLLMGILLGSKYELFCFLIFLRKKFNDVIPIIFRIKSNKKS